MNLLVLDGATGVSSAMLQVGEQQFHRCDTATGHRAGLLLQSVSELFAEADKSLSSLDGIIFCHGPASFTGLRITLGIVQGLAFAHDIPVVGISSLQAMAYQANQLTGCQNVLALLDAKMREVYWGYYTIGDRIVGTDHLSALSEIPAPTGACVLIGDREYTEGVRSQYPASFSDLIDESYPRAACLLALGLQEMRAGHAVSAKHAAIKYLREGVV